ncbi:hypothetical protein M0R45_010339 [Rubus argutus]|uniref:UBA domain-containing protein n=1 Tax=Rubus argutus TaxID=59490 RepID=A0AAW1Y988_RUBAR
MAVPVANKKLLEELESMGFPRVRATRALHYSGNANLEAAIDWIVDHENDPDIDQMPLVTVDINIESPEPFEITEVMKIKAQELRDQVRKKKKEEEKKMEQLREREREKLEFCLLICYMIFTSLHLRFNLMLQFFLFGLSFNLSKDNARKRNIDFRNSEKEEEKRARERIRWKLEQDKLERRGKLGLSPSTKLSIPVMREKQKSMPVLSIAKSELMRECLRSLRRNHKNDDARVQRAFQTLLIYVGNVPKNPDEEKFRKIRLSNPSFLVRVGNLIGGIEFLELCGFEKTEGGQFLYLPRDKVDMSILYSAASELKSALTNPFFGLL